MAEFWVYCVQKNIDRSGGAGLPGAMGESMHLSKQIESMYDDAVRIRQDLHRIPEIGFQLRDTQAYVLRELRQCSPDRIDAIVVAAELVTMVQTVITRDVDPHQDALLTLGKIQGGTSHNVIAEEVTISGTLRVFSNDLYRTLSHKIAALMQGLETATGAQIDMDRKVRYPSVRNPRELVEQFYTVLDSMDDTVLVEPVMAAEDFAEYQQEIPGLFFFLGVQEPTGTAPLHSSHFNFDERVLLTGVETFKRILECESKCTKKK